MPPTSRLYVKDNLILLEVKERENYVSILEDTNQNAYSQMTLRQKEKRAVHDLQLFINLH